MEYKVCFPFPRSQYSENSREEHHRRDLEYLDTYVMNFRGLYEEGKYEEAGAIIEEICSILPNEKNSILNILIDDRFIDMIVDIYTPTINVLSIHIIQLLHYITWYLERVVPQYQTPLLMDKIGQSLLSSNILENNYAKKFVSFLSFYIPYDLWHLNRFFLNTNDESVKCQYYVNVVSYISDESDLQAIISELIDVINGINDDAIFYALQTIKKGLIHECFRKRCIKEEWYCFISEMVFSEISRIQIICYDLLSNLIPFIDPEIVKSPKFISIQHIRTVILSHSIGCKKGALLFLEHYASVYPNCIISGENYSLLKAFFIIFEKESFSIKLLILKVISAALVNSISLNIDLIDSLPCFLNTIEDASSEDQINLWRAISLLIHHNSQYDNDIIRVINNITLHEIDENLRAILTSIENSIIRN